MWQTFYGNRVYYTPEGHEVWQNPWYRWLTFSTKPIQSIISLNNPSKPVTTCIKSVRFAAMQAPGDILHMGLGGGCVAHTLMPYRNNFNWTFIDIDPQVINIAKTYFYLERLQPYQLFCTDAFEYIAQDKATYQHIIIDIADTTGFPENGINETFFLNCANRLSAQGILCINLPNPKQHNCVLTLIKQCFKAVFILLIPNMTNIVIVAGNFPDSQLLIEYIKLRTHCKFLYWQAEYGLISQL